jgi:hypothetical protein
LLAFGSILLLLGCTVVKQGHTKGIERGKTLSQKSTVIAFQSELQVLLALEGTTLKSKLPRALPSNYKLPLIFEKNEFFLVFQI